MTDHVLSIRNLTVKFPITFDCKNAVEGLSFDVHPREIVCGVGESGSGKSITSLATMGLLSPGLKMTSGEIDFAGQDLLQMTEDARSDMRGDQMAMIFQEPMAALNPAFTVGNQIEEVFRVHRDMAADHDRHGASLM